MVTQNSLYNYVHVCMCTLEAVLPCLSSLPILPISSRSFSLYRSEAISQLWAINSQSQLYSNTEKIQVPTWDMSWKRWSKWNDVQREAAAAKIPWTFSTWWEQFAMLIKLRDCYRCIYLNGIFVNLHLPNSCEFFHWQLRPQELNNRFELLSVLRLVEVTLETKKGKEYATKT